MSSHIKMIFYNASHYIINIHILFLSYLIYKLLYMRVIRSKSLNFQPKDIKKMIMKVMKQ